VAGRSRGKGGESQADSPLSPIWHLMSRPRDHDLSRNQEAYTQPTEPPRHPWRTPFSISLWEDLVVMNSLSFCSSGNVLIFPSFLNDSFAGYWILDWQFSSFRHFMSSHCLPRLHGFWWEIGCLPYWGDLVPDKLLPSCFFLDFLFVFWQFDYNMS